MPTNPIFSVLPVAPVRRLSTSGWRCAAPLLERRRAAVTLLDLADYPMPLYDGDLEESDGLPEPARRLKALFHECDGFLSAAPEYNSGVGYSKPKRFSARLDPDIMCKEHK